MGLDASTFFVVFTRTAAVLSVAPLFSGKSLPMVIKVACALLLSLILAPSVRPGPWSRSLDLAFVGILLTEMFIGFVIGSLVQLLFMAAEMAGQWISLQLGFGFGGLYDPQTDTTTDALPVVYRWFVLILFLGANGHHQILQALAKSLEWLPPGDAIQYSKGYMGWLLSVGSLFSISFQLAAPLLIVLWLTGIVLALLARLVPQFNVFLIDFPIKIAVGFLGAAFGFPILGWSFGVLLHHSWPHLKNVLIHLHG